ncbi:MAG: hypothetical protein FGM43_05795 [Sinobacteraceae bacterium]|nr:hypothetical protein [Nevskiaceae bacterium]
MQLHLVRRSVWLACGALLLAPAIGMLVSDEVNWGPEDFLLAALLLGAVAVVFELAVRASSSLAYRLASMLTVLGSVVLIAGNAAVGIVGNEGNPINRWFVMVPIMGLVAALWAKFEPAGMSRALLAMAVAQVVASVMVFVLSGAYTFVLMCVFAAVWLCAAELFRKAAAEPEADRSLD